MGNKTESAILSEWGFRYQALDFIETILKNEDLEGLYEFHDDYSLVNYTLGNYFLFQVKTINSSTSFSLRPEMLNKYVEHAKKENIFWEIEDRENWKYFLCFSANAPIIFQGVLHKGETEFSIDDLEQYLLKPKQKNNKNLIEAISTIKDNNLSLKLKPREHVFEQEHIYDSIKKMSRVKNIMPLFKEEVDFSSAMDRLVSKVKDIAEKKKKNNSYEQYKGKPKEFRQQLITTLSLYRDMVFFTNLNNNKKEKFKENLEIFKKILNNEIQNEYIEKQHYDFLNFLRLNKNDVDWNIVEILGLYLGDLQNGHLLNIHTFDIYAIVLTKIKILQDKYKKTGHDNSEIFKYLNGLHIGEESEEIFRIDFGELLLLYLWGTQ